MTNNIFSLDLETSASDISIGGTILSIGLVNYLSGETFESKVGHASLVVEPGAMRVNRMDVCKLDDESLPSMSHVDYVCSQWLAGQLGSKKPRQATALGLNVASFDLAYLQKFLPKTFALFSYRSIDLNAICMFTDDLMGLESGATRKTINTKIPNLSAHDALSDAKWNVAAYKYLVKDSPTEVYIV